MPRKARGPTVAIIGGGFTGAAVAFHLARSSVSDSLRIIVAEPRERLGGGVAYSTSEPSFRINVPADKMSLIAGDSGHFRRWLDASGELDADPQAWASGGRVFPCRAVFGRYVAGQMRPLVDAGKVEHRRSRAVSIARKGQGYSVSFETGPPLDPDFVVLAVTHPPPGVPAPLRALAEQPGFVADIYADRAFDGIAPEDRVLIVGNGLSAADAVAALDARGHGGPIVGLSRRGLRSRGHAEKPASWISDFTAAPAETALGLLRAIRRELVRSGRAGAGWHAVFDALREQAPAIWTGLPPTERARLVRHLRVFWDVHRFRVAPQVEEVLDRRSADGSFRLVAGSLQSAEHTASGVLVRYRRKGTSTTEAATFDAIIVTTGPDHRAVIAGNEVVRSAAQLGLIMPDRSGLGLATSATGRAIDTHGAVVSDLFVAGPLARGTFGELMGLPEVARYAEFIAAEIAGALTRGKPPRLDSTSAPATAWFDRAPGSAG